MNIKKMREKTGVTRQELAVMTGLSYSYLTKLERGEREASDKCLQLLQDAFANPAAKLSQTTNLPLTPSFSKDKNFILEVKLGKRKGTLHLHIEGDIVSEHGVKIISLVQQLLENGA